MTRTFTMAVAALALATFFASPAPAQDHSGHGGHAGHGASPPAPPAGGHDGHAGHGAAAPAARGSWAYTGRDLPPRHLRNRWEMVPADGSGAFVAAGKLPPVERCKALLGSATLMVDRATREACASVMPRGADVPAAAAPAARPAPASQPHQH